MPLPGSTGTTELYRIANHRSGCGGRKCLTPGGAGPGHLVPRRLRFRASHYRPCRRRWRSRRRHARCMTRSRTRCWSARRNWRAGSGTSTRATRRNSSPTTRAVPVTGSHLWGQGHGHLAELGYDLGELLADPHDERAHASTSRRSGAAPGRRAWSRRPHLGASLGRRRQRDHGRSASHSGPTYTSRRQDRAAVVLIKAIDTTLND